MLHRLLKKIASPLKLHKYKAGELYSIPNQGKYGIFKVLKVDPKGVHVRVYSNRYSKVPSKINSSELFIDTKDPSSTKHTPLTFSSIQLWNPSFLQNTKVEKDELKDYFSWKYNSPYYV
jgi:hypothetical protein